MFRALRNLARLLTIARTLARHDALAPLSSVIEGAGLAPAIIFTARLITGSPSRALARRRPGHRLAAALTELGPVFIKLGQLLSTRADLLGEQVAEDLSALQDRLPPFPAAAARAEIESSFGQPIAELFAGFDDTPVSAASIAQVHYATVAQQAAIGEVAVKVLRPGIEQAFDKDIDLMRWLAELVERTQPKLRRLKATEVVETFAETVRIEMDLRLEAAAAAELAENFAGDPTYRVPAVDWRRTSRRVLTLARLTGIPMDDRDALLKAGHVIEAILVKAAAIFFNQVFRDGYFHGDQHPGNMFVDGDGNIGAVDFGIMGRLDRRTRYYLADMLLAFLDRDYGRVADVHLAAGYVPLHQSRDNFAQACRSIGEPIFGQPLEKISFARMLAQLFQIGAAFEMEVQPQLLLLQKNMLMAEGVSRLLNPDLNIWTLARPLIEEWMRDNRGPEARLRDASAEFARVVERLPALFTDLERVASRLADGGLRLHPDTLSQLRPGRSAGQWLLWAIGLAALLLAGLALLR
ncbi:MAG: 2-polyprenylphenol 6-hydroxylase [Dongiaceae bacterium]